MVRPGYPRGDGLAGTHALRPVSQSPLCTASRCAACLSRSRAQPLQVVCPSTGDRTTKRPSSSRTNQCSRLSARWPDHQRGDAEAMPCTRRRNRTHTASTQPRSPVHLRTSLHPLLADPHEAAQRSRQEPLRTRRDGSCSHPRGGLTALSPADVVGANLPNKVGCNVDAIQREAPRHRRPVVIPTTVLC